MKRLGVFGPGLLLKCAVVVIVGASTPLHAFSSGSTGPSERADLTITVTSPGAWRVTAVDSSGDRTTAALADDRTCDEVRLASLAAGPTDVSAVSVDGQQIRFASTFLPPGANRRIELDDEFGGAVAATISGPESGDRVRGAVVDVLPLNMTGTTTRQRWTYGSTALSIAADGGGRVRVPTHPNGRVAVRVAAAGRRTCFFKLSAGAVGSERFAHWRLPPGACLDGQVFRADHSPAEGSVVIAFPVDLAVSLRGPLRADSVLASKSGPLLLAEGSHGEVYAPISTRTDALGRFRLTGLGCGEEYTIVIVEPRHAVVTEHVRTHDDDRPSTIRVVLATEEEPVIRVIDEDGTPVIGAVCDVRAASPVASTVVTDSNGEAAIPGLMHDQARVVVYSSEHASAVVQVRRGHGSPTVVTLRDRARPSSGGNLTWSGRVAVPEGSAHPRGRVSLSEFEGKSTRVTRNGAFRFVGLTRLPAHATLQLLGFEPTTMAIDASSETTIVAGPRRGAWLRLHLPDDVQPPVFLAIRARGNDGDSRSLRVHADEWRGRLVEVPVPVVSEHVRVTIRGPGIATHDTDELRVSEVASLTPVGLRRESSVRGRLVDVEGIALVGRSIRVEDHEGFELARGITDDAGRFRFSGLDERVASVAFRHTLLSPTVVRVPANDASPLEVRVRSVRTINLRVGGSCPRARVPVRVLDGLREAAVTGSAGIAHLLVNADGTSHVRVRVGSKREGTVVDIPRSSNEWIVNR